MSAGAVAAAVSASRAAAARRERIIVYNAEIEVIAAKEKLNDSDIEFILSKSSYLQFCNFKLLWYKISSQNKRVILRENMEDDDFMSNMVKENYITQEQRDKLKHARVSPEDVMILGSVMCTLFLSLIIFSLLEIKKYYELAANPWVMNISILVGPFVLLYLANIPFSKYKQRKLKQCQNLIDTLF